ncbi:MAG: dockerin type I repeat-containing protein [Clostridia bacterium]|nr:dockerin type I repeat-containing protein [Clostridia bacterium]
MQVFYTNSLLKASSTDFNKSGKLYSCAKSYSSSTLSKSMTANGKQKFYPVNWSDTNKSKYDFCNISMVPSGEDSAYSVDNLDENIAVLHLASGTATGDGTVFISAESVKSEQNISGETYLSCLTDNGKTASKRYDFGSDCAIDTSKASLKFVVTDLGDVDNSKTINSIDALMILQHVTDIKPQTGDALRRCDVNGDGTGNSADALAVLQIATGLLHLNDIYKK